MFNLLWERARDLLGRARVRELIRYALIGLMTTVVNYGSYALLTRVMAVNAYIASGLAWVLSVTVSYIFNRRFVFESRDPRVGREFAAFFSSRVAAWLVDYGVFWLCHGRLGMLDLHAKLVANVLVVVINYFVGRYLVFRSAHRR